MPFRPSLGVSDFAALRRSGAGYVDKTRLILDVLEDPAGTLLFPRPRRFGKTLNLSTLRYFLERSAEDRSALFEGLEVWSSEAARYHFQRYPVIWITFKDIKCTSFELTLAAIRKEVSGMYEHHRYLLETDALSAAEADRFETILRREGDETLYAGALRELSKHLARHHGERVVVLIDEYDTPIHAGYANGFYDDVIRFFRNFLSGGLKDNEYLFRGVMTGILRVARESLFSGLNNIVVYSILAGRHSASFGFTEPEVRAILEPERDPALLDRLRGYYNGYLFGVRDGAPVAIYNPWSVLSFVADAARLLRPHWLMTASDDLLRQLLLERGYGLTDDMELLLKGEGLEKEIDENIVLRDVQQRPDAVWSFLLFSGYLKTLRVWIDEEGVTAGELAIPNREVRVMFKRVFQDWLSRGLGTSREVELLTGALLAGDVARLEKLLSTLLLKTMSFMDPGGREPEKLYQGSILGLLVHLETEYDVRSNRETGLGRADLLVRPRQPGKPGVVLELKVLEDGETVEHALADALAQVRERRYAAELEAAGAAPVHQLAAVFDGKRTWVRKDQAAPGGMSSDLA
jgi:hypothetical protein